MVKFVFVLVRHEYNQANPYDLLEVFSSSASAVRKAWESTDRPVEEMPEDDGEALNLCSVPFFHSFSVERHEVLD